MSREIKLDGGEITILKTLGLSGTQMAGKVLLDRVEDMETAEVLDTLDSLLTLGYVISNRVNVRKIEEVEHSIFRVNPAYLRELRDALNPSRAREREQRGRRQRRA